MTGGRSWLRSRRRASRTTASSWSSTPCSRASATGAWRPGRPRSQSRFSGSRLRKRVVTYGPSLQQVVTASLAPLAGCAMRLEQRQNEVARCSGWPRIASSSKLGRIRREHDKKTKHQQESRRRAGGAITPAPWRHRQRLDELTAIDGNSKPICASLALQDAHAQTMTVFSRQWLEDFEPVRRQDPYRLIGLRVARCRAVTGSAETRQLLNGGVCACTSSVLRGTSTTANHSGRGSHGDHPDRLKEEREREEYDRSPASRAGAASGGETGRRPLTCRTPGFIENMLQGGGIDAALFCGGGRRGCDAPDARAPGKSPRSAGYPPGVVAYLLSRYGAGRGTGSSCWRAELSDVWPGTVLAGARSCPVSRVTERA